MLKKIKNIISVKESLIQKSIIEWANYCFIHPNKNKEKIIDYLFHIPNGGYRNIIEAVNFKRMGVKSGVPDLFFAYPRRDKHGMFLELKTQEGLLNTNQNKFLERMNNINYQVAVIRSLEQCIKCFHDYLKE